MLVSFGGRGDWGGVEGGGDIEELDELVEEGGGVEELDELPLV